MIVAKGRSVKLLVSVFTIMNEDYRLYHLLES